MKINLLAPINPLGYGVAGLNIYKALSKVADVALHVIGQPNVSSLEDQAAVIQGIEKAKMFDPNAPCVKIWHQNQMAEFVGKGTHIGFPIFELDKFTDIEKHHLGSCDRLMVCSNWAKGIVLDQIPSFGAEKVDIVPLGVDQSVFQATPRRLADGRIIFLNCGKWEVRKGHDVLIEAFKKTLLHYDNIELWMMCSNPFNSSAENLKWAQLYSHPKVRLIPRAETQKDVYNIMCQADCGVFPSRGEGWNLELLEMMAVGRHVIATDYSAHTEFCSQENCGLIKVQELEPAIDNKWFFGQGNWAKLNEKAIFDLSVCMQLFIEKKQQFNHAGLETAKKFSWDNSALAVLRALET